MQTLQFSGYVDHVVGDTATLVERPEGKTLVTITIEAGSFRIATGDQTGTIAAPVATIDDGSGSGLLIEGTSAEINPAPASFTLAGEDADSIATLIWA